MMANLRQLANVNVTTLRTFRQNFTSEHTVAYGMNSVRTLWWQQMPANKILALKLGGTLAIYTFYI